MALFALVVVLLGGYVGAYIGLGEFQWVDNLSTQDLYGERNFTHEWLPTIFSPAAIVEGVIRRKHVAAVHRRHGGCGFVSDR